MTLGRHLLIRLCFVGVFIGILLVVIRAKSLVDAFLLLQRRVPTDPFALFGNVLVIVSALSLIYLKRH